jgi:F420-dependent oxidoreductase-like protein
MIELPSPCLVVLVGVAGSGKSTWAQTNLPDVVVSSDVLRAVVGEGTHDLRASADAFELVDQIVERRLRRRLTTVIDSLGTDAARRERWRASAAQHGVPCVAVLFDVPAAQVRRQNRARPDRVPDAVVRSQLAGWASVMAQIATEPFHAVHRADPAALVPAALVPAGLVPAGLAPAAPVRSLRPDAHPGSDGPGFHRLRFGLQIPRIDWSEGAAVVGERLRNTARMAERVGFDDIWVMDHLRQIPLHGPPWADILDSWTTLAHLAACTERVRLGTLVTAVTFRNVVQLGKIVATLDVLSGGRAECGLGLGWYQDEHAAAGIAFPTVGKRYALLEDALQLLPRLWGPGAKPFEGAVLRVPDTTCYPRPLQAHVPITVGGSGERRTLRLVAQYADACNLFGDETSVQRKVAVLHEHCRAVQRDPAQVRVSHLSTVMVGGDAVQVRELVDLTRTPRMSAERHARAVNAGTVDQHVQRVERLRAAGATHMIVSLGDLTATSDAVERYGRVIAQCRVA